MTRGERMGSEVGHVAASIARVVECSVCGIGIAVDMVGKRWGEPPYDWKGERFDHACPVSSAGLNPKQVAAVAAIESELETWAHKYRGGDYQADLGDTRLPPEAR